MNQTAANLHPQRHHQDDVHKAARSVVDKLTNQSVSESFSAAELLQQHPELEQFHSCVLDLVYEEYCRLREQGKPVQPSVFARQYPAIEQSFFRVLEFDQILQAHPSLIEHVPEERWPKEGGTFCGFDLLEQIGRGALSRVFVARQPDLGMRSVVLKVCVRGQREADLLAKLQHRGITPIHSIHQDPESGLSTICMPYQTRVTMHQMAEWLASHAEKSRSLLGADVRAEVQELNDDERLTPDAQEQETSGRLAVQDGDAIGIVILKWGIQLATALAHAHQKGVLHCDVKPGNVLLLQDLSASLLDFNLASSTDDAVGLAGGTLPYMAPEQLQRLLPPKSENSSTEHPDATNGHSGSPERSNISEESPASTATDVFGLAATMWHMVSGEPPFGVGVDLENREESAAELLNRQREGVSKAGLQKAHQILSAPAVEVLLKGLEWNPKDRHSSAAALADELKALVPATRQRRSLLRTAAFPIALAAVVVPTILAVLPLPLWLTPLSFPSTPTASLPTETLSSDQFQPIPYVDQARELIGNRRFDDAQIALEPVLETDPTAQFFDLYCRTCKLKHLPRQALNSIPVEDATKGSNWETIAVEWLGFASVGEFTSEANVNLAYLLLEFGDSPEFERSRKHLEAAISAGVTEPKVVQTLALLNLKAENDSLTALKMPDGLRQSVLQTGTRGEILAYLCILRKALEADPEEFHPELNALVDEAIDRCFSVNEPMVEPQAAKLLFHGSLHQKVGLNKKVTDVLHRSRTDSRNPMNRLADVLMLPRKDAVKIASNDR